MFKPDSALSELYNIYFCVSRYCGIRDPSWAELHHFVNFLNSQLSDFEQSIFCDPALVGDILHGFRSFVVRFLIQMSRVSLSLKFLWIPSPVIDVSNYIF